MLDYQTLLNLMTKHFPRWMDIRKRVKTSAGGKYLRSLAEEVADIQIAIDEYKKDFFLINYLDKYDDIPSYVYYINVGNIDPSLLNIIVPENLDYTDEAKTFYNTKNMYLYEDGKIFFQKYNIDETSAQVRYSYDDNEYASVISKLYVWNIYDEFAAFVGLKRYEGETNEELTSRVLNVFKCIPNSTEDGLKNAIINETLPIINDLYSSFTFDEIRDKIIIERPTPENLSLKYDAFTTILDKLAEINRDVYRTKSWDFDIWSFKLAGVDYIPHVWDYVLAAYQNGVGFDDDLKPEIITDTESESSASIHLYRKDESVITEYLSGHAIEKDLRFELIKYSNDLNATIVKYTIRACSPIDITEIANTINLQINSGDVISNIALSDFIHLEENESLYINYITESFIIYNKTTGEYRIKRISYDDPLIISSIGTSDLSNTYFSVVSSDTNIESIFVTIDDNTSSKNYDVTNRHAGQFTYFYLTSKNQEVHTAYNSIRTYTKITENIEIANNFTPILQLNNFLVYSIIGTSNCVAEFQDGQIDDQIGSWCLGNSLIRLESNINYENVEYNHYLFSGSFSTNSPSIYFEDLFIEDNAHNFISNDNEDIDLKNFDISKYEVNCLTDNISVTYSRCDKSADHLTTQDINKYVRGVIIEDIDNYVKLPHVKIDEILYIGSDDTWSPGEPIRDSYPDPYELLDEKGIIVFNKHIEKLYIVYKVYVPEYVTISTDELYKLVEYNTSAYAKISETRVNHITDGYVFELSSIDNYGPDCNVIVSGYSSNYIPAIINDTVVFNKVPDNVLSIKYGYYYFGEQEYYLLADKEPTTDQSIMNTEFNNTYIKDSKVILNKRSVNNIKNSAMTLNTVSNTYYVDTLKHADLISYNKLGAYSTCDNFYRWQTFGARLSPYVYDDQLGIKIYPEVKNGYAYINITNENPGDYYLSLYIIGTINAYIVKERRHDGLEFHRSISTEFAYTLNPIGNRLYAYYTQDPDYDYYLVITGDGVYDDIVLIDSDKVSYIQDKKNLDIIGFNIPEKTSVEDFTQRIYIDNKHSTNDRVDIDDNGYLIPSSYVDWGITKLFEYKTGEDFKNNIEFRSKVNIDSEYSYLYTLNTVGTIETAPFKITNIDIIKNLVMEINDMPFDNMTGFQTQLLVSETIDGTYSYVGNTIYDNIGSFDADLLTGNYIKLHIVIPANKVIGSIALYAEYKMTDSSEPSGAIYSTGSVLSGILDTHYRSNYKLSHIDFDTDCNISDFSIMIRAFREDYIWTSWKEVGFDYNGNILSDIEFLDSRYFQVRIDLKTSNARIRINHIDLTKVVHV